MGWYEMLPGVYEVTTDLSTDLWLQSLADLQACDAQVPDHYFNQPDLGSMSIEPQSQACSEVLRYFQSDAWLQELSRLCDFNDDWKTNWGSPSPQWFRQHTGFAHSWHMAPPNYITHNWHVDCLRTVAHGMMYLCEGNDPTATTLFRDVEKDLPVTTGFNRGWIILQNGRQYHRGINYSQSRRYTFKWMLTLNI